MKLLKPSQNVSSSTQPIFHGDVFSAAVVHFGPDSLPPLSELKVGLVRFCSGSRTLLHTHDGDQLLIIVEGNGHIGGPSGDIAVTEGDVVHIPAGEAHYHGATATTSMSHYSLLSGSSTEILAPVEFWPPALQALQGKAG